MKTLILFIALSVSIFAQSFPTTVYTPLVAKDNIATTLASAMTAGDNVAVVTSGTGWAANMVAYICESNATGTAGKCAGSFEAMLVTNVNGQNLTVTRGYGGTSAIAHSKNRAISNSVTAVYNTTLSDEVHAIETALGTVATQGQWTVNSPTATGAVAWEYQDVGLALGRRIDADGDPTKAYNTLWVQEDFNGTTGTPWAFASRLTVKNLITSQGVAASANYVTMAQDAATTAFGVHGECDFTWAANAGACIGLNAEGSAQVTGSSVGLIGIVSNMNINSVAGASATVLGAQIQMNNPHANMTADSAGIQMQANSGTIPKGLYIYDNGGHFTNPLIVNTTLSPAVSVALLSTASGTNDAPNSIGFYRGSLSDLLGTIQADHANGNFGLGTLHIKAVNTGVLYDVMTFDYNKNATLFGHLAQNSGLNDTAGTVTLSTATSGAFTFGTAYTAQPSCSVTPAADLGAGVRWWATTSTSALTVTTSSAVSAVFNYVCVGNPN